MTRDRFRADSAVRRVVPLPSRPPSPQVFASETHKDRSGKHGSEVA